ncbi:MAG TPA: biotin/lipoyl-binding protein, partial [Flavisolibacter sp.]
MKRNLMLMALVALFTASCGNSKKDQQAILNDKKVKLQKLRTEQKEIATEIETLEADIAREDPSMRVRAAKLVSVSPVMSQNFSHYIELQGRVDARNIAYVAPPNGQGGIVKALYVTRGQFVRRGQVLARLDDQVLRQQLEPLRVQLNAAEDTYRRT